MSDEKAGSSNPVEQGRLPCRGCTADCINFADCQGRPWRYGLSTLSSEEASAWEAPASASVRNSD
jgi:hypothetical protein